MKRDVLLSIGLLPLCYGALMWLTFDEHRGSIRADQGAPTNTIERTSFAKTVALADTGAVGADESTSLEDIGASEMLVDAELADEEEIAEVHAMPDAASPEPLAPPSYSLQTQSVQSLSNIIEQSTNRESRVTAVNTLLLMGRKSLVDPAVIAALKKAANVPDSAVSSLAISALAEVERETH